MKIVVCGSINASDKLIEISDKLIQLGHQTELPFYTQKIKNGEMDLKKFIGDKARNGGDLEFRQTASEDLIKRYFRLISQSDAIIVVNVEKNGIADYIGGNTFLEMGYAYALDKSIFLLNNIPNLGYKDEMIAMKPIVLNGDLNRITHA